MSNLAPASAAKLRRYWSPGTVIGRFTARRMLRSSMFLALVFGVFVASKAAGFVSAFPNEATRQVALHGFTNSTSIVAIIGRPAELTSVGSFAAWNTLITMVLIGGVWGLLAATRTLRGEEENGRWELFLSGPTTARRALLNVLWGLGLALVCMFVLTAAVFAAVGQMHGVGYAWTGGVLFAGTVVLGTAAFMAVGVFTSQLMPTRSRASLVAAAVFGLAFLIRALADVANASWLLSFSPLGWIEQVYPLATNHAIWLLPVVGWIVALVGASLWLANRRDLGASTFADRDTAKPHFAMLRRPLPAAIRLTRTTTLSWALGIGLVSLFFGSLTKTAAQAFSETAKGAPAILSKLTHSSAQTQGALEFLGVIFLLMMILVMCFAAASMHAVRQDEANGYLDNMLVRPVSRFGWLAGRIALVVATTLAVAFLASVVVRASLSWQGLQVPWRDVLLGGVNMFAPTLFVTGLGVLMIGFWPRLTSLVTYSVPAWSFLVQMINSGVKLNHWLLDTSVFQHIALAPATSVRWGTWWLMIGLAAGMMVLGMIGFLGRDITNE